MRGVVFSVSCFFFIIWLQWEGGDGGFRDETYFGTAMNWSIFRIMENDRLCNSYFWDSWDSWTYMKAIRQIARGKFWVL
jgi:hypothetical protein